MVACGGGGGGTDDSWLYPLWIETDVLVAGDINGDGLNDLVVLGGNNQVIVLQQSTTSPGTYLAPQFLN